MTRLQYLLGLGIAHEVNQTREKKYASGKPSISLKVHNKEKLPVFI